MDLETRDPNLMERGPGDIRGDGEVVGIALGAAGSSRYYPIAHAEGLNCDRDNVCRYVSEVLSRCRRVTGANLYYDLGWLRTLGIDVNPFQFTIEDVQLYEPLIDEEAPSYSLDAIMRKYLGRGKREEELKEAARSAGYKDHKGNLWRLPASAVGLYAEEDVRGPLEVLTLQKKEIEKQDLHEILALEQDVFWVVLEMRRQGVAVDVERALALDNEYVAKESHLLLQICNDAGFEVNPWSPDDLVRLFVQENLNFETTPKGNPSFEAEFLAKIEHPIVKQCVEYRKISKMRRDFIHGGVIDWSINGRIHPEMHPLRGETHGTRVGRFSYSRPNLQQQPSPSRDKFWGPLIRSLYVPEHGKWARFDYSQQEPRLTIHFAALRGFPGAREDAQLFIENPDTDFHQFVADMVGIERRPAKDINLGMAYGMGKRKIIESLGVDSKTGVDYWNRYHKRFPYIKMLSDELMQLASSRGYIRTIGGRRKRFEKWNPVDWDLRKKDGYRAYIKSIAQEKWPGEPLCRAFTHKALNNLSQGSGGDVTKKAMVNVFKGSGFLPLLQVHDELDYELETHEDIIFVKETMESAYKDRMKVPFKVDVTVGENWGVCS